MLDLCFLTIEPIFNLQIRLRSVELSMDHRSRERNSRGPSRFHVHKIATVDLPS
jgi:hypothetical protein